MKAPNFRAEHAKYLHLDIPREAEYAKLIQYILQGMPLGEIAGIYNVGTSTITTKLCSARDIIVSRVYVEKAGSRHDARMLQIEGLVGFLGLRCVRALRSTGKRFSYMPSNAEQFEIIKDLTSRTQSEILGTNGVGRSGLRAIEEFLDSQNLGLTYDRDGYDEIVRARDLRYSREHCAFQPSSLWRWG